MLTKNNTTRWLLLTAGVMSLLVPAALAGKGGGKGKPGGGDPAIAFLRFRAKLGGTQQSEGALMVMDADGSNQKVIYKQQGNTAADMLSGTSWSPDGTKIAFSIAAGGAMTLHTINKDGRDLSPVTTGTDPAWSPDGTQIAYRFQNDVWLVDVDGSNSLNVTNTSGVHESLPAWSADGTRLAYKADGDLVVRVLATGVETSAIAGGPLSGAYPPSRHAWARTADELAASRGGIWIIDLADPTNPVRLPGTYGVPGQPPMWQASWSPDDSKLVVVRDWEIYTINADGTGETLLAQVALSGKWTSGRLESPDWKR